MEKDQIMSTSPNGKLLQKLIEENELQVGNFTTQRNGYWTRIQRKKDGEICKSVIDYVLFQKDALSYLDNMVVDEEKIHCPYRQYNTKKRKKIVFSDHCAILLTLRVEYEVKKMKGVSFKAWKFTEEGYKQYKEKSEPMQYC